MKEIVFIFVHEIIKWFGISEAKLVWFLRAEYIDECTFFYFMELKWKNSKL